MPSEETVDELVDKAIDEALARSERDSEDIKKRKDNFFVSRKDLFLNVSLCLRF